MRPPRQGWGAHFLDMAFLVSGQGTCARRAVGCVITDVRNRVLATGFNGVPPGLSHCFGDPSHEEICACPGADAPSGTRLDECLATHAEANALVQCAKIDDAFALHSTASPCISCIKMIMCTNIQKILFVEEYPHPAARDLWIKNALKVKTRQGAMFFSREWIRYKRSDDGSLTICELTVGAGC